MTKKQKLELTWIGKENRPRLEPRILLEDPEKSYHAQYRVKEWPQENAKNTKDSDSLRSLRSFAAKHPSEAGDLFDNRLIFGDNLLALKALEQEFTGKIKCIYIDPPYNTGSAFTHYDDGTEHSIWLSLIRDRLEILRSFCKCPGRSRDAFTVLQTQASVRARNRSTQGSVLALYQAPNGRRNC